MGETPSPAAAPAPAVTALFDPRDVYRALGFVTGSGSIPFVGNARLLAGPTGDTAIALVALSMQNRNFAFQSDSNGFSAAYRVELTFRQGASPVKQVAQDERVVVATFPETRRAESNILYQTFVPIPVGTYDLAIVVRDRNGPNVGRYEGSFDVPRLQAPAIATPVPVYRAAPRASLDAMPDLVANPRSTVDYGTDSLRAYVETYGLPAGSAVAASVIDSAGRVGWADTVHIDSTRALRAILLTIAPSRLALGPHVLRVGTVGADDVARATFLVAFSGAWAVANFDQMISLLRYFTSADTLRALERTPPDQREAAWRRFWRETDPDPTTPENEALDSYFARLRIANEEFRDEGIPGWLTDRGEVYATLGQPDEVLDQHPDQRERGHTIVWEYSQLNLTLYYIDETGFGRMRLDPRSRSDFYQTVNRLRHFP